MLRQMRFSFLFAAALAASVHAQSLSVGVVAGSSLSADYATYQYPVTVYFPDGVAAGFNQIASGPRRVIAGPMVDIGFTPRFSVDVNALYRPVSYRNSFVGVDG